MRKFLRYVSIVLVLCAVLLPGNAAAGVNDFTISNFSAEYHLSKDSDGRSRLTVTERITAEFPNFDQNHGIERAIPHAYDGHTLHLQVTSVQKPDGSNWNYSTSMQGDATVLRIGDADRYVRGTQSYVIGYTVRDATKFFSNTNDDELYWDVNGTGWQQPFAKVAATLYVDKTLAKELNGKYSCSQGPKGSTERCSIMAGEDLATGTKLFSATATRQLAAGENVTFAVGFKSHTFAAYKASKTEKYMALLVVGFILSVTVGSVFGFVLIVWFIVRHHRNKYRKGDMGAVAPEYLPPKGVSVLAAAKVFSEGKGNAQSAQILDLAVRHYIKIYQTEGKGIFKSTEYELELVKPVADLLPEEHTFVATLFGDGNRLALKTLKNNSGMYQTFLSNDKQLVKSLREPAYGLYEKDIEEARWFKRASIITLIIGLVTVSPLVLVAAGIAYGFSRTIVQVSEKGLALERYLYGLRDYIKLAEVDRLKMLQSPEGAEKVGETIDGNNTVQLVKLYERVLPYALLFGLEKQWNEQLSKYYEVANTQPVWYNSTAPFSAVAFSSAMSSFSAASSYSSSSGGSSGSSSGGGGGGGGGGGW